MKATAAEMGKDDLRWRLSWHPDGRSDSFTREAILACAPRTSGVYGLFNFDCQIFIGEAANIQEALLRHESETDFQSRHLRPTGFTFEACAAEVRKAKADELIARFHPVLQNEAGLTKTWSPSDNPEVSEVSLGGEELENYADHREFPVHEHEQRSKARRRFYFARARRALWAATLVTSAVVIFSVGIPAVKTIQNRGDGANEKKSAVAFDHTAPASGQAEVALSPQSASSSEMGGGLANQSTEPTPAEPEIPASASTPNVATQFAAKGTSAGNRAGIQETAPMARSAGNAASSKKWSVQISAAPAKDIADALVQRLKANGYDGYVVQGEVKGQTYYRVRVGPFDAREEAESARQSLARREGYRDAYLTGD